MKAVFARVPSQEQVRTGPGEQSADSLPQARNPTPDQNVGAIRIIWMIRGFLLAEIATFLILASVHFALLIGGYRHPAAAATELTVVAVLIIGLLMTWMSSNRSLRAATVAQSFATLGVLVGLLASALGVGSRTIPDLILNVFLLLTLGAGLVIVRRGAQGDPRAIVAGGSVG
jgi:hypothetical protein